MAVVGFVTKSMGSVMTATRTGSSIPFAATLVTGRFLGSFSSVREAQKEIEKSTGRLLRWTLEPTIDFVERYRGEEIGV
jgi:hypothetical protein